MSLFTASLNSGSNGNCYYIANEQEAVLVDVGISCREVIKRMARLGLSIDKVKAIFISHEHSDHISGVRVLATKYNLPVYITPLTLKNSGLFLPEQLIKHFVAYDFIRIGNLSVTPFPKIHDCADGHSFIVSGNHVNIGVLTDIGSVCEHVINNFKCCHAVFLEANYDEVMLEEGNYPWYLKNRIRGGKGHLSNKQALDFFVAYKPDFMSHVFLSHLSKQNNQPELVYNLFAKHTTKTEIVVATRSEETSVYRIQNVHSLTSKSMNTFYTIKSNAF
jgi:phosphoribosyl 1,2-cyclic phosphodiesterase